MSPQVLGSDVTGLAPDELAALRANLVAQRSFRLTQLRRLEAAGPDGGIAPDGARGPGERGTKDSPPRELRARRAASARMMLADVEAALKRMDEDSYGGCHACAARITPERLTVIPQARYCAPCQYTGRGRR